MVISNRGIIFQWNYIVEIGGIFNMYVSDFFPTLPDPTKKLNCYYTIHILFRFSSINSCMLLTMLFYQMTFTSYKQSPEEKIVICFVFIQDKKKQ